MAEKYSTRNFVLSVLREKLQSGSFCSGEELAEGASVSRTAIWKAVDSLRSEGYKIEAVTNAGYRLLPASDVLDEEDIVYYFQNSLQNDFRIPPLFVYKTVDSTNSVAAGFISTAGMLRNADGLLTESGKKYHRSVVIAAEQTAGRGRLGRPFYSPEKRGVYLSLVYAPQGGINDPAWMTAAAAVAVCRSLEKLFDIQPQIKWVNDIFYKNKKVCGILTEGITNFETGLIEAAIVGIGINIYGSEDDFPEKIAETAGSVCDTDFSSRKISRSELVGEIIYQLLSIYDAMSESSEHAASCFSRREVLSEYKSLSFLIGKRVIVSPVVGQNKTDYEALVCDINENAGLIVQLGDGTVKTLQSGEVSLHSSQFTNYKR